MEVIERFKGLETASEREMLEIYLFQLQVLEFLAFQAYSKLFVLYSCLSIHYLAYQIFMQRIKAYLYEC